MSAPGKNKKSSARFIAHQAVVRIESDGAYTDIVLSHLLRRSELDPRDRAFISELVRGVIRWKKRLDWIVDQLFTGKRDQLPAEVRWILREGLYQLHYMRTPVFAAVNESVNIARSLKLHRWTGVINGLLRNFARRPDAIRFPDPKTAPVDYLAVAESHPQWLVKRWIDQFGFETTEALCRANNTAPELSVRPNSSQISLPDFIEKLKANDVDFRPSMVPRFIRIRKIDFDFREQLLNEGLMTIQDASAGLPVMLADPQPGQVVFDLCAAPGGKSMLAAELLHDRGVVVSGDKNKARAGLVRRAAQRLRHDSISSVVADALHFPARQADVVLLDAPCTGLGVLRKKPDLRWRKREPDIEQLSVLQKKMIQKASQYVRPGGVLVYSTCTIDREENENVVADFLRRNSDFEIERPAMQDFATKEGFIRTWPHLHHTDGSFAAKLIKRF